MKKRFSKEEHEALRKARLFSRKTSDAYRLANGSTNDTFARKRQK